VRNENVVQGFELCTSARAPSCLVQLARGEQNGGISQNEIAIEAPLSCLSPLASAWVATAVAALMKLSTM